MTEHYFSEKQESSFRRESFVVDMGEWKLKINSGSGIFSLKEMDFGTKQLIENAKIPEKARELLDLGCGYGIMGIAMKRLHPELNVTMVDINERAIKLAKENCEENDAECLVLKSNIFSNPEMHGKRFDVILTNPPFSAGKKICKDFIEQSYIHLNIKGFFELVAPHNKGGESLKKIMLSTFGNVGELAKKRGYRVYLSIRKA